jgi:hypothetical protein
MLPQPAAISSFHVGKRQAAKLPFQRFQLPTRIGIYHPNAPVEKCDKVAMCDAVLDDFRDCQLRCRWNCNGHRSERVN